MSWEQKAEVKGKEAMTCFCSRYSAKEGFSEINVKLEEAAPMPYEMHLTEEGVKMGHLNITLTKKNRRFLIFSNKKLLVKHLNVFLNALKATYEFEGRK